MQGYEMGGLPFLSAYQLLLLVVGESIVSVFSDQLPLLVNTFHRCLGCIGHVLYSAGMLQELMLEL